MPHPDGLPDLFIDRSLGRLRVPQLLRDHGLRLVTLAERYGIPADEGIPDEVWLNDAGGQGEAVLLKDRRVRYNPAERTAIETHGVRGFCLTRADLPGDVMAARFLDNLDRIAEACAEAGPLLYAVHETKIERLSL